MRYPPHRPQLLAAIRHESGHILAALLVFIRIRWSIARHDGLGATEFVQPLETFANRRLTALWDYVMADPQSVTARWAALHQAFADNRPPTPQELPFAYRVIAMLMAGTIAEGKEFLYRRGNSGIAVDDATKVSSTVALLKIPVAEVRALEAHLHAIMPIFVPVVTAAFSRQSDGNHAYVHTVATERAIAQHPATAHRLLRRAPRKSPLLGMMAVGTLAFFGLRSLARSA